MQYTVYLTRPDGSKERMACYSLGEVCALRVMWRGAGVIRVVKGAA